MQTFIKIRDEILSGGMRPGERIVLSDVSDRLALSVDTIEEVLPMLISEKLIISERQTGFRVAPISISDLHDLTRVRIEIERRCLTHAIEKGTLAWEANILTALYNLFDWGFGSDQERSKWSALHTAFHQSLVSACDNRWLAQIRYRLHEQGERYRQISMQFPGRSSEIMREHAELAFAVVERKTVTACKLMTDHLLRTEKYTLLMINSTQA